MHFLAKGVAAVLVTSVCCGAVSVTAEHDPLYRAQPHTSTITAVAVDEDVGVASIRIEVIVGQLTACTELGGLAGLIPCRSGATVSVRECTFDNATRPAACSFPVTIGAGQERLITYKAAATSATGGTATTESVTYAAGTPLTQVTVTLGPEPVVQQWATARPVAWHTDGPPGVPLLANKLDVGFFPDVDFGTAYDLFIEKMEPIARGAYLDTSEPFSRQFVEAKTLFNLWVGPAGADGDDCKHDFAGDALATASVTDGDVILHQSAFADCSTISLGGAGTTQADLGDASWVFTHESGHFLIGLGDEYVGGGNESVSDPRNIYASETACQDAASELGVPPSSCREIVNSAWRMRDVNFSIMANRDLESDWLTASGIALSRRLQRCKSGSCY